LIIPEYVIKNGLRFVKSYNHTYNCYVKIRWKDKEILKTFGEEFLGFNEEYYKKAIEEGRILVNGKKVGVDYKL
jgi:tRNA pseudouridine synthase 9